MKKGLLRSGRRYFVCVVAFVLVILLPALRAYTAINYLSPNRPYFTGSFAAAPPETATSLTVVSYNIWFGEDIDQALIDLKEIGAQRSLGVILLQEMDEIGTEHIAQELKMNYVYFPAAIEPTYDRNFGNAILSSWPISDAQKLILPHKSLSNRMIRTATRATVHLPQGDVLVYSLHAESIFSMPQFKREQYLTVLQDIPSAAKWVVIGGDFNTFTPGAVDDLNDVYQPAGFISAAQQAGASVVKFGVELPSDHIFVKGFDVPSAGKLTSAAASDHLPIWVTLIPKQRKDNGS